MLHIKRTFLWIMYLPMNSVNKTQFMTSMQFLREYTLLEVQ